MSARGRGHLGIWASLALLVLAGCASWQPGALRPDQVPTSVRVTLRTASVVQVDDGLIRDDTLLVGRGLLTESVAVPLREVVGVQTLAFDADRTLAALLVSGVVAVPLFYTAFLILANICTGPCT